MRISRVGPLSVAKVAFVLYGLMGLIVGCIVALASVLGASLGTALGGEHGGSSMIGALFGVGAIVLFPLFYGAFGALVALVSAAIYNLVAGMVGGVEITLDPAPTR